MAQDTNKTTVVFRKYRKGGAILALMPYEINDHKLNVMSYEHVGQHGGANYSHCIAITKPVTPAEYADLKREMEGLGYNFTVTQKINRTKYFEAVAKMRLQYA